VLMCVLAAVGYHTVPLVKALLIIMYPVAKPIALALDLILGKEIGTFYTKGEV
jgi:metal transporter CNNM